MCAASSIAGAAEISRTRLALPESSTSSAPARETSLGVDGVSVVGSELDDAKAGGSLIIEGHLGGDKRQGDFVFAGQLDVRAMLKETTVLGFEAPEAYVAYAPTDGALRLSAGRKLEDWSQMDDAFGLGLWQPRYLWNRARPEAAGFAGLSAGIETSALRIQGTFMPVFVPDRGYPVNEQDGELLTQDPYFDGPGKVVGIYGVDTPVRYSLNQPPLADVIFNPGVAFMARAGEKRGVWGQAAYAYKPMNQLRFVYDSVLDLNTNPQQAEVTIYPEVLYHHIASFELGYRATEARGWLSFTTDTPVMNSAADAQDASTLTLQMFEPAQTISLGGAWSPRFAELSAAFMHTAGGSAPDIGENASGTSSAFEARYPYADALTLGAAIPLVTKGATRLAAHTRLLLDLTNSGSVWSTEIEWRPGAYQGALSVRAGADLLASGLDAAALEASSSFISRYRARDRFHLGVAYVF